MDKQDFSRWTAQKPPVDFADKAVSAMLAQQSQAQTKRQQKRRRWPGFLVLAAAFVGTTAWATLGRRQAPEEPPAPVVYVYREVRSAVPQPVTSPVAGRAVQLEEAEPKPPPPPPRRVAVSPPPEAPAASASAPPRVDLLGPKVVRYPRCECQPHISFCSCVE